MDKCFVIEEGCNYEGGGVSGVSLDYEKAITYAYSLVKERQIENDEHYKWDIQHTKDMRRDDPTLFKDFTEDEFQEYLESKHQVWKEEKKGYWSNGMDYIRVGEMDFIN